MPDITISSLHALNEFQRCVDISREVWGEPELDVEPYVTFVVTDHTGGQVLGAFDGDKLVGFTKAVVGLHGLTPYLHSHMTAVLAPYRNRGVGRLLKLFQREDAIRRGIRLVEWTFDPLETKNAHFNLNRLGAICRRYIPDFYGITTSPLHRGIPTDRLLAEWHLESPRVLAAINNLTREPFDPPATVHLPAPVAQGESSSPAAFSSPSSSESGAPPAVSEGGSWVSPSTPPSSSTPSLVDLQSRIRAEFTQWFSKGYAATSVRFTPSGVDYCLSPYSDF